MEGSPFLFLTQSCLRAFSGALDIGIKDPDLGPGGFVFLNELLVLGVNLISVVGSLVHENQLQSHIKIKVVHLTSQGFVHGSCRVKDHSRVPRQVFVAGLNQLFPAFGRFFLEGEINIVGEHS